VSSRKAKAHFHKKAYLSAKSTMTVIRITVTLPEELGKDIQELAAKDKRKLASMATLLLDRQVKEINRKKKKGED